jgi:hypothetical protein
VTAYGLINLLTTACAPDAEFMAGSDLWWVPPNGRYSAKPKGYLVVSTTRPTKDAVNLSLNENGPMKVGL